MKRRVVGLLAALILASGLQMSAGAEDLTNDYILGNSSLNLLNGGVFSEEDLNIEDYTGGASYSSINVFTDQDCTGGSLQWREQGIVSGRGCDLPDVCGQ